MFPKSYYIALEFYNKVLFMKKKIFRVYYQPVILNFTPTYFSVLADTFIENIL